MLKSGSDCCSFGESFRNGLKVGKTHKLSKVDRRKVSKVLKYYHTMTFFSNSLHIHNRCRHDTCMQTVDRRRCLFWVLYRPRRFPVGKHVSSISNWKTNFGVCAKITIFGELVEFDMLKNIDYEIQHHFYKWPPNLQIPRGPSINQWPYLLLRKFAFIFAFLRALYNLYFSWFFTQ